MAKITPIEVIQYVTDHENLRLGVRLMAGEYKPAAKVLAYQDVAAFLAFQIIELHGEATCDSFMSELGQVNDDPQEESRLPSCKRPWRRTQIAASP